MYDFSIGVMLESFKLNSRRQSKTKELGAEGHSVYATYGGFLPQFGRRKAKRISGHGKVQRTCDFRFMRRSRKRLPRSCKESGADRGVEADLRPCKGLETNIVTTHIGVVPSDPANERYQIMQEACFKLAQYADSLDAHFAIETGPEESAVLKKFLDGLHSTGVAVNMDTRKPRHGDGGRSVQAVYNLKDYIVHTHAKDGRRNYYRAPEEVYGLVEAEMLASPSFTELPLGTGNVDFRILKKRWMKSAITAFDSGKRVEIRRKRIFERVEFLQKLIR